MSDDEETVVQVENAWITAVRLRDLAYLNSLLLPDFTLTTGRSNAEVRSRNEYLEIVEKSYRVTQCHFQEIAVRIFGMVAVVQSRYWQEAEFDQVNRSGPFRLTDVLVNEGDTWRALLRHSSAIPASSSQG